ncbi:MAG: hypothetical protein KIT09_17315 [Bryobacteraceae bacterium]|nr:hypothetical protein [Bryobacteraceae bacterium]
MCELATVAALELKFGLKFDDLYRREGLQVLDSRFLKYLEGLDPALLQRLAAARARPEALAAKERSELILALAPVVESFIAELFGIADELEELRSRHLEPERLFFVKRQFVQRSQYVKTAAPEAARIDGEALAAELEALFGEPFSEEAYAAHVARWLETEAANRDNLVLAGRYAAWALNTEEGRRMHIFGALFRFPQKIDMYNLVPAEAIVRNGVEQKGLGGEHWRSRDGFQLTDAGMNLVEALDQARYCIKCHNQGKDSCSTGLIEKTGAFRQTVFGVTLNGCPLEEKISEFQTLKEQGHALGALAVIAIDNPMAAATGHRICNDCMKSCIYQKQEPVNIPQVETRTLKDALALPWGFEIY